MWAIIPDRRKPIDNQPVTPEEAAKYVKNTETAMSVGWYIALIVFGLFVLAMGKVYHSIWGYVIGYSLLLLSLFIIKEDDILGKVIASFLFFAPGFLLLIDGHVGLAIMGASLYLLGFIISFNLHKAYGIIVAIILLIFHIIVLL
jgi:hypothetical protein